MVTRLLAIALFGSSLGSNPEIGAKKVVSFKAEQKVKIKK